MGGSILASLGTFHQLWISKEEWDVGDSYMFPSVVLTFGSAGTWKGYCWSEVQVSCMNIVPSVTLLDALSYTLSQMIKSNP